MSVYGIEFSLGLVNNKSKYLTKDFQVTKNKEQQATPLQLYAYIVTIISTLNLSREDWEALPRIYSKISTLYPDAVAAYAMRTFSQIANGVNLNVFLGERVTTIRESLSLLVLMKESMKLQHHYYMLLWQMVLTENQRGTDYIKRSSVVDDMFVCEVPLNWKKKETLQFCLKFGSNFGFTEQPAEKIQELVQLLNHPDKYCQRLAKTQLKNYKASRASEAQNAFLKLLSQFEMLNAHFKEKAKTASATYFPLFGKWKRCVERIEQEGQRLVKAGKSDKWTVEDLQKLKPFWDAIKRDIHQLDEAYEYLYHEFQFVMNQNLPQPEMREAWVPLLNKRMCVSVMEARAKTAGTEELQRPLLPSPEVFSQNFFAFTVYQECTPEKLQDFSSHSLTISEEIVETVSNKVEQKKEEEKKSTPLTKGKTDKKSYFKQQIHLLEQQHTAAFPEGIQYDPRVERWFHVQPADTLKEKFAILKHRLPKMLDFLLGTSYSRTGKYQKDGKNDPSWYLVLDITAFGFETNGVLAYTFDPEGVLYHRYFEKEALGNVELSSIISWIAEKTQNPTPQEVNRMDKMKKEADSLALVPKAKPLSIPAGMKMEIEPYFGTITLEYDDPQLQTKVKIEVFKPN